MENCIVKQYKTAVNNPNLEYFDSVFVKIDWSQTSAPAIVITNTGVFNIGAHGVTVRIISNGYIAKNESDTERFSEWTIPDVINEIRQVFPVNRSVITEFIVKGLSKIKKLHFNRQNGTWIRNLDVLNYCEKIQPDYDNSNNKRLAMYYPYPNVEVDLTNYVKNINNKEEITSIWLYIPNASDATTYGKFFVNASAVEGYSALTSINRNFPILGGNISSFESLTSIQSLGVGVSGRESEGVTGDIKSLGKLKNLTSFNINSTRISGSIDGNDGLVAAFRSPSSTGAGDERVSGTVTVSFNDSTNITYKGNKITLSNKKIVWTASEIWVEGIDPEPMPEV